MRRDMKLRYGLSLIFSVIAIFLFVWEPETEEERVARIEWEAIDSAFEQGELQPPAIAAEIDSCIEWLRRFIENRDTEIPSPSREAGYGAMQRCTIHLQTDDPAEIERVENWVIHRRTANSRWSAGKNVMRALASPIDHCNHDSGVAFETPTYEKRLWTPSTELRGHGIAFVESYDLNDGPEGGVDRRVLVWARTWEAWYELNGPLPCVIW